MVVMRDSTRQISRIILVKVLTMKSKIPLNTKPAPAMIARSQPMLALIVVELPTDPRPPVDSEAGNARSEMTAMAMKAPSCARKMSAKIRSFHLRSWLDQLAAFRRFEGSYVSHALGFHVVEFALDQLSLLRRSVVPLAAGCLTLLVVLRLLRLWRRRRILIVLCTTIAATVIAVAVPAIVAIRLSLAVLRSRRHGRWGVSRLRSLRLLLEACRWIRVLRHGAWSRLLFGAREASRQSIAEMRGLEGERERRVRLGESESGGATGGESLQLEGRRL